MGNGVSSDQGNLPSYGKRDVRRAADRKQHDWPELAVAPETNSLLATANSYSITEDKIFATDFLRFFRVISKKRKKSCFLKSEKNEKYVFSNTASWHHATVLVDMQCTVL